MVKEGEVYKYFKREIYRIGWRLQYREKKIRNRECSLHNNDPSCENFSTLVEEKIWIKQILSGLPKKGELIIKKLYLEGLTEAEVAEQLHISQQAVSKWKRKMIQKLFQTANY
ncbi:hypothetical protein A9P44_10195 [Paenibacillus polymyxa]|nr:sigma-70 family RNA polymerase sigma factor [Paenibacillus polymyxa]OBA07233.1 hypothetical protein A9P44_10195 [Paenibacillus polymyxa]